MDGQNKKDEGKDGQNKEDEEKDGQNKEDRGKDGQNKEDEETDEQNKEDWQNKYDEQARTQDLSEGGKISREARKKFFAPPWNCFVQKVN